MSGAGIPYIIVKILCVCKIYDVLKLVLIIWLNLLGRGHLLIDSQAIISNIYLLLASPAFMLYSHDQITK